MSEGPTMTTTATSSESSSTITSTTTSTLISTTSASTSTDVPSNARNAGAIAGLVIFSLALVVGFLAGAWWLRRSFALFHCLVTASCCQAAIAIDALQPV